MREVREVREVRIRNKTEKVGRLFGWRGMYVLSHYYRPCNFGFSALRQENRSVYNYHHHQQKQQQLLSPANYLTNTAIMAEPTIEIAETVQTASVNPDPSPAHDINPTISVSEKKSHVPESAITDDTDSIPSDVVDPSRMVRTVVRQKHLPPLPDLRFEQSYLASLKDADTWGRVAWITIRDQVGLCSLEKTRRACLIMTRIGHSPANPGHPLDSRPLRMAILEPQCLVER